MSVRWISAVLLCFCLFERTESFLPLLSERSGGADCDTDCDEAEGEEVCGSDGRTYESECEIERAKCQGHPVYIRHRGKCSGKGRCELQRAMVMEEGRTKPGMFVPECKEDGSYAEVQCHHSTGYCWCVDEDGKPLRGSSIKNARPNCSRSGKRSNKRRSNRGRRNKKTCSNTDRASFNANLIDIFESEYSRLPQPPTTTSSTALDPLTDTYEKAVIQWKFDQLDLNHDQYLKKREVRDLRRMAKKIVKPKACAKTFAKYCDLDQDKKISKSEWSVCVGVDINISFRLFMSLNSDEQVNGLDRVLDDEPTVEDNEDAKEDSHPDLLNKQHRPRLRHDRRISHPVGNDASDVSSKEEENQDCATARQIAMENHKQDPAAGIYIPECTADGLYVRAQCHKSTKYCWCVNPRSGKPIRGTATQGVKPDCDSARKGAKSFKGCSLHRKQEFLDELVESFIKEMSEDAKNKSASSSEIPTPEKAARWKFSSIDANSNMVLDKREWKAFKKEWRSFHKEAKTKRRLRKCWRNLPRFCDENNNQKITVDEWLVCTGITRDYKGVLPRNQRRRGPNPFDTILKSD